MHLGKIISEHPGQDSFEGTNRRVDIPVDSLYYNSGAGFVFPEGIQSGRYEAQFRRKLQKTGLDRIHLEIQVHKWIYNESFREIAEALGIVSIGTAFKLYRDGLEYLKKVGFGK